MKDKAVHGARPLGCSAVGSMRDTFAAELRERDTRAKSISLYGERKAKVRTNARLPRLIQIL